MSVEDARKNLETLLNGLLGKIALTLLLALVGGIMTYQISTNKGLQDTINTHTGQLAGVETRLEDLGKAVNNHDNLVDTNEKQIKEDLEAQRKEAKADDERRQGEVVKSIQDLSKSLNAQKSDLLMIRQSLIDAKPSIVIPFSPD